MGHDSIQKISISFYPLYPPKNDYFCKIWPFRHFLVLFGFFLTPYTPPKKQKKYYIGTILPFWHFLALLGFFLPPMPPKNPKNDYFDKMWPFWHFLALFWGGVKIAQKKIMLFKYSPLARQDSKNFYTHCFLIISQIILTGAGLSRNFLHLLFRTEFQELTVHDISGLKFPKADAIIHCI